MKKMRGNRLGVRGRRPNRIPLLSKGSVNTVGGKKDKRTKHDRRRFVKNGVFHPIHLSTTIVHQGSRRKIRREAATDLDQE